MMIKGILSIALATATGQTVGNEGALRGSSARSPLQITPRPRSQRAAEYRPRRRFGISLPSAVHVLQKFYTDDNCQVENTALTEAMYPQNNVAPDGFTDPSYEEGVCSELVGPINDPPIFIPFEHSGKLRCGPGNCEATLDWHRGCKTCDCPIFDSMTFTFPPGATDGTMSACVVTNGAGSDEECSVGGQACSRAIQYHEFLPGQTPIHIHEYCECN